MAARKVKIDEIVRIFNGPSGKWENRSLEMVVGEHAAFLTLVKYRNNIQDRGFPVIQQGPVEPLLPGPGYEPFRGLPEFAQQHAPNKPSPMDIEKAKAQNFGRSIMDTGVPVPVGEDYMVNSKAPRKDTFQEINLDRNTSEVNGRNPIHSYRPLTSKIQIQPSIGDNLEYSSMDNTFGEPNFEYPESGPECGHKIL